MNVIEQHARTVSVVGMLPNELSSNALNPFKLELLTVLISQFTRNPSL